MTKEKIEILFKIYEREIAKKPFFKRWIAKVRFQEWKPMFEELLENYDGIPIESTFRWDK